MRLLRTLRTLVLALATFSALPSTAAPAPAPGRDLAPAVALTHRAEHLKKAFMAGNPAEVNATLREVETLRRTYGTLDVLPLVEAMAMWARTLGERGNPVLGLQVIQAVDSWAPRHPALLGTRIILLRQQGLSGWITSIPELLELTKVRLSHPTQRWLWALQHLAWARIMAVLLLWSWTLAMALRYRNVFRDLWEEPLGRKGLGRHIVAFAGACLVTAPVLLGMDPCVAAILWLCLLAPYLAPSEARASLLVILLQLVHPGLALLEPKALSQPEPSVVALQMRPQTVSDEVSGLVNLSAVDRTFLAGWRQLQAQDWARAEATFQSLVGRHPDVAQVQNNLGVARFQKGDVAGASKCFDEAWRLENRSAEILLNQSIIAFRNLDASIGRAKQEEARIVNPVTFGRIMAANQSQTAQRTFPMPMPDSPERILSLMGRKPRGDDAPVWTTPILAALIVTAGGALAFHLRQMGSHGGGHHPHQCARCGDPFHGTDSPDGNVCSKCHHLFVIKDGLHGESRKRKVDGVAAFQRAQRWIHRTLMVVAPGADLCFTGETRGGLMELGGVCFSLAILLTGGRMVRYPGEALQDPASVWAPLGVGLAVLFFVRSWFKLLPRRS